MQESKLLGTLFVIFQKVAVHEGRRYRVIFSVRHHTRIVLEGDQSLPEKGIIGVTSSPWLGAGGLRVHHTQTKHGSCSLNPVNWLAEL